MVSMLQLRQIRGDAGLSQQALAKMVGVRQTTISSWETGTTSPDAEQLWNLAVALGCTPNDLLGWVDDVPPVVDVYSKLDAGKREMVDTMAQSLLLTQQVEELQASSAARRSA